MFRAAFLPLLLALVLNANLVFAQVQIIEQFANMEASASARCPGEEDPEPDFQKRWLTASGNVNEDFYVEMSAAACGDARFDDYLSITYGANTIDGTYGAWSGINGLSGGYAHITGHIRFQVLAPTTYELSSIGEFLELISPDIGNSYFRLHGGSITHDTRDADWWDENWSGTFQPDIVYTIEMHSSSSRAARELPGGEILDQDGTTNQDIRFTLTVDAVVVSTDEKSWGTWKARY